MFASGRKGDINIRGAFAHMASDALIALGVVLTGFAIRATGWLWLDPVASIGIGVVIAVATWSLLRESINLAMDAVPENVDADAVESMLASIAGVSAVHDLHIWAMSTTETCLTAHLEAPAGLDYTALTCAQTELHEHFGIAHSTIQVERGDASEPCAQADEAAV